MKKLVFVGVLIGFLLFVSHHAKIEEPSFADVVRINPASPLGARVPRPQPPVLNLGRVAFDLPRKERIQLRHDAIRFHETRALFDRNRLAKPMIEEWMRSAERRSIISKIIEDVDWAVEQWGPLQAEVRVFALEVLYEHMRRGDVESVERAMMVVREDLGRGKTEKGREEDFSELLSYYLEAKEISSFPELLPILEQLRWDQKLIPCIANAIRRTPRLAHFVNSSGSKEFSQFIDSQMIPE